MTCVFVTGSRDAVKREVDAFGQTDWFKSTFNKANEYVGTGASRKVRGTKPKPYARKDEFSDADTIGAYDVRDTTNDGFEIAGSYLKFTAVGQSTYDEEQEDEVRAFCITGENIGSLRSYTAALTVSYWFARF